MKTCPMTGIKAHYTKFAANGYLATADNFRRANGLTVAQVRTFFNRLNG